jgi:hypothetical protein
MSSREMPMIIKNCFSIFDKMGTPYKIKADNEFNKGEFNEMMKELNIKVVYADPYEINKNPIVERFNRTLASFLQRIRLATKDYNWPSYLSDAIDNYNTTYHKTIGHTPKEIFDGKEFNEQTITRIENPFALNEKVRLVIKKKVFDKGDKMTHSKEVYKIIDIKNGRYKVNDNTNKYYKYYELLKVGDLHYKEPVEKETPVVKKEPVSRPKVENIEPRRGSRERKKNTKDDFAY